MEDGGDRIHRNSIVEKEDEVQLTHTWKEEVNITHKFDLHMKTTLHILSEFEKM